MIRILSDTANQIEISKAPGYIWFMINGDQSIYFLAGETILEFLPGNDFPVIIPETDFPDALITPVEVDIDFRIKQ